LLIDASISTVVDFKLFYTYGEGEDLTDASLVSKFVSKFPRPDRWTHSALGLKSPAGMLLSMEIIN
jgi:hypothetical protein